MVYAIPDNIIDYILEAPSKAAANFFYLTIYKAQRNEKEKQSIPLERVGAFRAEDWALVQDINKEKLQSKVGALSFIDEVDSIYLKSSTKKIKVFTVEKQSNGIKTFDYCRGVITYKYTQEFYELLQEGFRNRTQGDNGTIKGSWFKDTAEKDEEKTNTELKRFLDVSKNSKYIYIKLNKSRKTNKTSKKASINIDEQMFLMSLGIDLQKAPSDIVRDILKKLCVMIKQTKADYGLYIALRNGRVFIKETDKIYLEDKNYTNWVLLDGIDKRTYTSEKRKAKAKQYDEYIHTPLLDSELTLLFE